MIVSFMDFCRHGEVWFELCQGGECVQLGLVSEAVAGPGRRRHAGKGCTRGTHGQALSMTQDSAENFSSSEFARPTKGRPLSWPRNAKRRTHPHTTAWNIAARALDSLPIGACLGSISTHQADPSTTAAVVTMAQPGMAWTLPLLTRSPTRSLHPVSLITKTSPSKHLTVHIMCAIRVAGEIHRASPRRHVQGAGSLLARPHAALRGQGRLLERDAVQEARLSRCMP